MNDPVDPRALRGDYEQLRRWARARYREGKTPHEVVAAIYGVDLPLEAYVFYRGLPKDKELPIDLCLLPWALLAMAEPAYEEQEIDVYWRERELEELRRDADFLPLGVLDVGDAERYLCMLVGYSLERLCRGDLTITAHSVMPDDGRPSTALAASLMELLDQWLTAFYEDEKASCEHPANARTGSDILVRDAIDWLQMAARIRRELAAQQAAALATS